MHMLLKVQIPVDAGNEAVKSGSIGKVMREFAEAAKPEAMYFSLADGWRTMYAVIDMTSSSDMPRLGEAFFMELEASIELTPCMNVEELMIGLKAAGHG